MDPLRLQQAAVKMFLAFFTARLQTLIANLLILIKSQVLYNFQYRLDVLPAIISSGSEVITDY